MRKYFALCCLACLFWISVPQALADFYLFLDGVPGESQAVGHRDEISLDSFGMGISNSGSGQPALSDITLTKPLDKSSPLLMLKCANGAAIPSAVLTCYRIIGGVSRKFYVIRLTDVKVTQISQGGSAGGLPYDTFSLNYRTIEWEYTPHDPNKGAPLTPVKANWTL
jgi:type VI secretion system secreted protein Hcp